MKTPMVLSVLFEGGEIQSSSGIDHWLEEMRVLMDLEWVDFGSSMAEYASSEMVISPEDNLISNGDGLFWIRTRLFAWVSDS
ncbi:hypothetical protein L2E82_39096 [Cichorium intybus]|uniref:Uncharacterized protein n=1 Tax=Cichorium intybus TaxID=13427 RepID=A0ACB9AHW2_CICIN|nr:hypothetical protein L2E82_39096 [Cichorium intybus]